MLLIHLRRYFAWVDSGRVHDAWLASGVARGQRYDRPHTKHHAPSAGYDAGQCAELDVDHTLRRIDDWLQTQRAQDREVIHQLLRWKSAQSGAETAQSERLSNAEIATRFRVSERMVATLWRDVSTALVNEVWPGASGDFARPA